MSQIRSVRNARAEYSVEPAKRIPASLVVSESRLVALEVGHVIYLNFCMLIPTDTVGDMCQDT